MGSSGRIPVRCERMRLDRQFAAAFVLGFRAFYDV